MESQIHQKFAILQLNAVVERQEKWLNSDKNSSFYIGYFEWKFALQDFKKICDPERTKCLDDGDRKSTILETVVIVINIMDLIWIRNLEPDAGLKGTDDSAILNLMFYNGDPNRPF
jgi:hypothetical protein